MQILQKELDNATQKLGKLSQDLQTYTKMTNQAFLLNNFKSHDNINQYSNSPISQNLDASSDIGNRNSPGQLKASQSYKITDFASNEQAMYSPTQQQSNLPLHLSLDQQQLIAAQKNLLPQLKFINLNQLDTQKQDNRYTKNSQKFPGSAGGAYSSVTHLIAQSPQGTDQMSIMEKSKMNDFNLQKTINTASGLSFFEDENKKLIDKKLIDEQKIITNQQILKHDYLSQKLFEFVKKYNQELFQFQQENGIYNTVSSQGISSKPRELSLLSASRGGLAMGLGGRKILHSGLGVLGKSNAMTSNPEQIFKNTKKLQKLALMQVIAITVVSNIDFIMSQPPHCFDRILQKSMIANLQQWLVHQNENFLQEYDEYSSVSFSLFKTNQQHPGYLISNHNRQNSQQESINQIQKSFESLLTSRNSNIANFKSPSSSKFINQPKGFLLRMEEQSGLINQDLRKNINNTTLAKLQTEKKVIKIKDLLDPFQKNINIKSQMSSGKNSSEQSRFPQINQKNFSQNQKSEDNIDHSQQQQNIYRKQQVQKVESFEQETVEDEGQKKQQHITGIDEDIDRKMLLKGTKYHRLVNNSKALTRRASIKLMNQMSMQIKQKTENNVYLKLQNKLKSTLVGQEDPSKGPKIRRLPLLKHYNYVELMEDLSSSVSEDDYYDISSKKKSTKKLIIKNEQSQIKTKPYNQENKDSEKLDSILENSIKSKEFQELSNQQSLDNKSKEIGEFDVSKMSQLQTPQEGEDSENNEESVSQEEEDEEEKQDSKKQKKVKINENDDTQQTDSQKSEKQDMKITKTKLTADERAAEARRKKQEKLNQKIPQRPFQAPPSIIDFTQDCQYEQKWIPILPAKDRKPLEQQNPEEFAAYKYDRSVVDRQLFEAFMDQGDIIRELAPQDLIEAGNFWKVENVLQDKAKLIIKQFEKLTPGPHDYFLIQPQSYNLSIQYDKDQKKDEAKKKQKDKKRKELLEQNDKIVEESPRKGQIDDDEELVKKPISLGPSKVAAGKSVGQAHLQMSQALEQIVAESENYSMPLFSRGPEIEITTLQDVEMLKALLAQIKIHLPAKTLERAIVMPRDIDNNHPEYPKVQETLIVNPFKQQKELKKKGKRKGADEGRMMRGADHSKSKMEGLELKHNEKKEYKVFEFGNYPLIEVEPSNFKPKNGVFRMMLPADADWTGKDAIVEGEVKKVLQKSATKLL